MDRRSLPAVHRLADHLDLPRVLAIAVARAAVDAARDAIEAGESADALALATADAERLRRLRPSSVVNATGVLLHTNLGRAPLHPDAAEAARTVALGYGNVELDLATGDRGGRGAWVHRLLTELTGAEAALVVNNNAGALLLVLMALATGRSVPVSRGELIEIGGSYRLPELMAASGARLVEVGTTNRTRVDDYRRALDDSTALLLKVHPSNYRVEGFTEDAGIDELARLGAEAGVPVVFDVGSGLLDATTPWLGLPPPAWLGDEPAVRQSLAAADLVLVSGDKLLGGPQAGLVLGAADLVTRVKAHPVARALRVPGPTLAALGATLELYAEGRAAEIPFWAMATTDPAVLRARAEAVASQAGGAVEERPGSVGGGSVPGSELPGPVVVTDHGDRRWRALLAGDPPIVARRDAGRLVVDLRAVPAELDPVVAERLAAS
ncbi:MAG: L-seryl-tRNA(Sec) selenium transferase [Acidimicrobiia bacterium]